MSGTDQEGQGVAALTDLFEEYYERITRYIAVRVGNQADAEELASDVFVRRGGEYRLVSMARRSAPGMAVPHCP